MHLTPTEQHQSEMRRAHFDGAPGILVSGLVWTCAALVCANYGIRQGVWALLIGGALIFPLSLVVCKILGRPGTTDKANALNQLAMATTLWLIVCCAMSYGLYLLQPLLFFPAMMVTIGCRYLVFASVFGRAIFWVLGLGLILAGNLSFFLALAPAAAAAVGALIEVLFAAVVFSRATRPTAQG